MICNPPVPYFFSVVVWVELLYFLLLYALLKCLGPLTVYAPCIRAELHLDQAAVVGVAPMLLDPGTHIDG